MPITHYTYNTNDLGVILVAFDTKATTAQADDANNDTNYITPLTANRILTQVYTVLNNAGVFNVG